MIPRTLSVRLKELVGPFPVVFLTGPRQSGKTTLVRAAFPEFRYISMEDLQNREEAMEDPRGFLRRLEGKNGAILDEIHLYFWHDARGIEIDLIMDMGNRRIPVEAKSGETVAADFCTGRIWGATEGVGGTFTATELLDTVLSITTFGKDEEGEIYVAHFSSAAGAVYRTSEIQAQDEPQLVASGGSVGCFFSAVLN